MAVRPSMAALINRVAVLINDPTNQTFTQQQVQDWLDRTRMPVRYELLTAAPDLVPQPGTAPGVFNWATYFSHFTDWEADEVIQGNLSGASWQILTPVNSDELTGRWQFDVILPAISTNIPAQLPPVFITGKYYDPYLAAAYLLEMWGAQLADAFDFSSDGQSFKRSQRMEGKLKLAALYRRNAKPVTSEVQRGDLQAPSSIQPVHLIGTTNDFNR